MVNAAVAFVCVSVRLFLLLLFMFVIAASATLANKDIHCESKKTGPLFMAYNFRNIEQIFTEFGTNQSLFNSEHRARVYLNQLWKIVAPSSEWR